MDSGVHHVDTAKVRRRNRADVVWLRQTYICGDGVCALAEDASICPADCSDRQLQTAEVGGEKGSRGHLFSVKSKRDIVITSLEFFSRSKQESLVQIYTREGGYSGHEFVRKDWELAHSSLMDLQGRTTPTSVEGLSVSVAADTLQSFFVFTPNKIRYAEGTTEGSILADDGVIEIYEGVGVRRKFRGVYSTDVYTPRAFTGSIGYEVASATGAGSDSATAAPTAAPSKSPSTAPVAESPTSLPSSASSKPPTAGPVAVSGGNSTQHNATHPATDSPTQSPTKTPSSNPTASPSRSPTLDPTDKPSTQPTRSPTVQPTAMPTPSPSKSPTPRMVKKISFVAFGDIPYTRNQRYCLNKQLRELNQAEMDFKFMAHVGDIKWGRSPCYESSFRDIAEMFSHPTNALAYDTRDCLFVQGDNEWMDCQDPDQAWRWWMQYFGNGNVPNANGFGTLSDPDISIEYEAQLLLANGDYPSSAGNFAFFTSNTLFVGINQIGGGRYGDEATRVHGNYKWVESNLAKYASEGMRALVVFAHATMTSSRRQYFGDPFMALLREEYPEIKALYVHGDGYNFESVQTDPGNPNLIQLEVDGGEEADPLLISVMHDTSLDEFSFSVDVRGGYYYEGCQTGNVDKTWSSAY
ncbi:hypothetical protein ACHAXT_006080 [Thalassiosira profunda]